MEVAKLHLGQEIRRIVDDKGISQAEFARSLGIQRQNIKKMVFERESLDSDLLQKISQVLECNLFDYLQGGVTTERNTTSLPYYKDLPATAGRVEQYPELLRSVGAGSIDIPEARGAEFVLPVIGCSMLPTIKEGEVIGLAHVERYETTNADRVYLIVTRDNERMIKRIIGYDNSRQVLTLASDNPSYPSFELAVDLILDVYKVVFHMVVETL